MNYSFLGTHAPALRLNTTRWKYIVAPSTTRGSYSTTAAWSAPEVTTPLSCCGSWWRNSTRRRGANPPLSSSRPPHPHPRHLLSSRRSGSSTLTNWIEVLSKDFDITYFYRKPRIWHSGYSDSFLCSTGIGVLTCGILFTHFSNEESYRSINTKKLWLRNRVYDIIATSPFFRGSSLGTRACNAALSHFHTDADHRNVR